MAPFVVKRNMLATEAKEIIQNSLPQLKVFSSKKFGEGWDNTAFEINESLIFRFPKRTSAIDFLQNEILALPLLQKRFGNDYKIKFPYPEYIGFSEKNGYPFYGYNKIPGKSACDFSLTEEERNSLATDYGNFLQKLHRTPMSEISHWKLCKEKENRVDKNLVCSRIKENIENLLDLRLLPKEKASFFLTFSTTMPVKTKTDLCLIHGDVYARHFMLNERKEWTGIIDWGSVNVAHPAIDYQSVFSFFPKKGQDRFFSIYGAIDEETRLLSLVKAVLVSSAMASFGHKAGDSALAAEGLWSLDNLYKNLC